MAAAKDGVLERREAIEAPLNKERFRTLARLVSDDAHKLVVSFGGGSIPGICGNLALARILEELDLRSEVEEIWGTSAGSVVGGGWATGAPALEILHYVRGLGKGKSVDFKPLRFAIAMLCCPFGRSAPDGLIEGRRFRETIAAGLRADTFEECEITFRCIASTDDGRARRKIFRRGKLLPAIFASMSIPGIMLPQPGDDEGNCYYDGGLVEKTPLISPIAEHMRGSDRRKLLLLGTHFDNEASQGSVRGFHNKFLQTIYALEELAWGYQLKEARERDGVGLMLLNPRLNEKALFDFDRVDINYLKSREAFCDLLQNAKIAQTFGLS